MSTIAIVGGGAAGFFAAIATKETNPNARVVIYERGSHVLAKVSISGGGRCNLTNSFQEIADLKTAYPRGSKLMQRLFNRFDYRDTYQWFEEHGVPLIVQEDQCVFPKAQDSLVIINALVQTAQRLGVEIKTQRTLTGIAYDNIHKSTISQESAYELSSIKDDLIENTAIPHGFVLSFKDRDPCRADFVILTMGGQPHIGQFDFLERMGQPITQPVPSLFTLCISDPNLTALMGTVVEASLSIPGTKLRSHGPLLITHWGLSGPATLKLSSYAARELYEARYCMPISINWMGGENALSVSQTLIDMQRQHPKKLMANTWPTSVSSRLWHYLLLRAGLTLDKPWCELGRKQLNRLSETLTNDTHQIVGKGKFKDEFVTCGGVSMSGIKPNTLESKHLPGLFFAGELLDIDAVTGGFNLQAAWTTGRVAGEEAAKLSQKQVSDD